MPRPSRGVTQLVAILARARDGEQCAAVASAVLYSALQSRGGDGLIALA